MIYFGPTGNPRAVPGGEGSLDDVTRVVVGPLDDTVHLVGEIENACDLDTLNAFVANAATFPPGSVIACTDASGTPYPQPTPGKYAIGVLASGATRHVHFIVSTPGTPLRQSLVGNNVVECVIQSRLDTLMVNQTDFRVVLPVLPRDPR